MSTDVPETERPLRADAQRNRDRVLEAARIAFAEGGPDVAVAEILKLAGVGSGTLFRHFPTKRDLLFAVLDQTFESMAVMLDDALRMSDPWAALVHVFEGFAEMQSSNQAVLQSVGPELFGDEHFVARNEIMMRRLAELVAKAQAAGVLRSDVVAEDIPFVMAAVGGATQQCGSGAVGTDPSLWRRYLSIVLDGLRPEGASPIAQTAPTLDQLMAAKTAAHAAKDKPV